MPPLTAKNLPKIGKNRKKFRKNREGSFTLPLLTDRAGYATGEENAETDICLFHKGILILK